MGYPVFFDQVESIKLYDPLGEFLGAFESGIVEISYLDCVKLAGHSCPTVGSAYLMAKLGLERLYPDSLPNRGEIEIELKAPKDDGVTGVIANVISYIAGAGDNGGFKGINGRFSRNDRVKFGMNDIQGIVRLTRMDIGKNVTLNSDTKHLPADPQMMALMQKILRSDASKEQIETFKKLWQKRVEALLLDDDIQNRVITLGE